MSLDLTRLLLALALASMAVGHPMVPQNKKNDCKHPPKILSQPSFSEDEKARWKGKPVSGRVAVVVNENGDVIAASVVFASPKEVGDALLNAAKRAKFQSRVGCGDLKTDVFFSFDR
jgi:hypothetical protein